MLTVGDTAGHRPGMAPSPAPPGWKRASPTRAGGSGEGVRGGGRYLEMQAALGVSKHMGGLAATRELLKLCHADGAGSLLDVGCGTGAGPVYVAKALGCRVTGVDLSTRMVGWARQRVRQEGLDHAVGLCAGDVSALPFPDDHFDVVICESVLDFVPDKAAALRECVRVAKPGGWVGINEALWLHEPTPGMAEQVKVALGVIVPDEKGWRSLWSGSGLEERVVQVRDVSAFEEVVGRASWIGWSWLLRAWGRALRLLLTDPEARRSLKQQLQFPPRVLALMGYGLMAGRKAGGQARPVAMSRSRAKTRASARTPSCSYSLVTHARTPGVLRAVARDNPEST